MTIDIKRDGWIEYRRDDDGWRTTIRPGDTALADKLLTAEERAEVAAAWTDDVLQARQERVAEAEAELAGQEPRGPSLQERVADLERAVTEDDATAREKVRENRRATSG